MAAAVSSNEEKRDHQAHQVHPEVGAETDRIAQAVIDAGIPAGMVRRMAFILALLAALNTPAAAAELKFVKRIGVGWQGDQFGWMGFVAFDKTGRSIASDGATSANDRSGDLSFWTFPEGRLLKTFKVRADGLSPDWNYYSDGLGVGRVSDGRKIIARAKDDYARYAFSPDSRYVAESKPDKRSARHGVRLFELSSAKVVRAFGGRDAVSIAIGPDDRILATGHWDMVALWDIATGKRLADLRGAGRYIDSLAFSRDGHWLAAVTDTGLVQIWDMRRRKKVAAHQLEGGSPSTPSFSPDARLFAVGTYGTGTVWLIETRTGRLLDQRRVSDLGCGSAVFNPNGRYLVTPSTGGLIKWPYDHGGTVRVFRVTKSKTSRHPPA